MKTPNINDIGMTLAVEAIQNCKSYTFPISFATLKISDPESISNFTIFADMLEAAYNKGKAETNVDANRYQWIRHGDNDELVLQRGPVDPTYVYLPRNEKLDKMIDDYIKE